MNVCVPVYVWVCACECILEEARNRAGLQGVVSHLMWVLGLELRSSERAVSACNSEAISLALILVYLRPCFIM